MPSTSNDVRGAAWLLADMALNVWALAIVKSYGDAYAATQIVFLRALVGLIVITPWIVLQRSHFRNVENKRLHLYRVVFSALALTSSFFAIARLPLALFTATSFIRPILTMIAAAILLKETIGKDRWCAAAVGFLGVMIAVDPMIVSNLSGIFAQAVTVSSATAVIIVTRRLFLAPVIVMMTFYTAGLMLVTAPLAAQSWEPVQVDDLPALLAIGVFAQCAQFCFLLAHRNGQASFLAILSYASLIFSTGVGFVVFGELPTLRFWIGAACIVTAALWVTQRARSTTDKSVRARV